MTPGPTDSGAFTGRAFRVPFRANADPGRGVCCGRVEHLRSGDAAHFTSVEELLSFVDYWLGGGARARVRPPTEP